MLRIEQGVFYTICQMVGELKMLDDKRKYVKKYVNPLTRGIEGILQMKMYMRMPLTRFQISPYIIYTIIENENKITVRIISDDRLIKEVLLEGVEGLENCFIEVL
jgi:hypothetical protein